LICSSSSRRCRDSWRLLSAVPSSGAGQLRALLRRLDGLGGRRLLLGDLNLCWPLVRVLALPGWRPLVHGGTFRNRPGGGRWPRVQLDHVLAAGRGGPLPHRARVVGGPASDHLAVGVELEWGSGYAWGRSNQVW